MEFVWFLLIGLAAGWLAGQVMKGRGFGAFGNMIVGVVGAILGGWLFGVLGLSSDGSLIGSLVTAFVGALVLLFVVGKIKK
ncbi:MAG: GlsB/YeaQ/YmgE family stress response membrane protein [bacterium]|nr:GlsB/YeaQ/YmgE family stress response membrane protein [bacterium]